MVLGAATSGAGSDGVAIAPASWTCLRMTFWSARICDVAYFRNDRPLVALSGHSTTSGCLQVQGPEIFREHSSRVSLGVDLLAHESLRRGWNARFDRVGTGAPGHTPLRIGWQAGAHSRLQFVAFLDRHCLQRRAHAPR